ncbi:MAG: hypothetical protein WC054_02560 [Candidatus Nanopelagicales bacterium]
MTFNWQFLDENLCFVTVPEDVAKPAEFHAQADAETWIGEEWEALLDAGVESVNLVNDGAIVYGPMSLHPTNPA